MSTSSSASMKISLASMSMRLIASTSMKLNDSLSTGRCAFHSLWRWREMTVISVSMSGCKGNKITLVKLPRLHIGHTTFLRCLLQWRQNRYPFLQPKKHAVWLPYPPVGSPLLGTSVVSKEARSETSQQDNPSWWQAMNGPFADEYWKAACVEVETHREYGCKGGQKYYMHIITISLRVYI